MCACLLGQAGIGSVLTPPSGGREGIWQKQHGVAERMFIARQTLNPQPFSSSEMLGKFTTQ